MGRPRTSRSYRTLDVPLPEAELPERLLATKLGSSGAAEEAMDGIASELGVPAAGSTRSVLAALALAKLGTDIDRAARGLDWKGFEDFCASAISAAGYDVRRNVRLRKPTRQIDIVAESPALVLAVDCKHWRRSAGEGGLRRAAAAQVERTVQLAQGTLGSSPKKHLPMLLTMLDNRVRVVDGVPVVPLASLPGFLAAVSASEEGLRFVGR